MKRILALILALPFLLLEPVYAEPVGAVLGEFADTFPAVTVTGTMTVDRDAARTAMEAVGIPEAQIDLWDSVLALLTDKQERLVIADEGFEYSLTGGDGETMYVVGEIRDEHAAVVTSLLPGVILTGEASGSDWTEIAAAAAAVVDELDQAMEAILAAVTEDAPVSGSYEIDGETFDTRVQLDIDVATIAEVGAALARNLIANEALRDAGLDTLSHYAGLRVEPSALPSVYATRYSDESTGATLYIAKIIPADGETDTVYVAVREDGDVIRVKIEALDGALEVSTDYAPIENGAHIVANVRYEGNDWALTVDVQTGDVATMTTALYFGGMDAPLAAEVNTFAMNGARTIAIDAEGKAALDIQNLQYLIERIG